MIPKGWRRIRGEKIKKGDKIATEEGWTLAEDMRRNKNSDAPIASAVGHPTALYECVIRREDEPKDKPKNRKRQAV